MNGSLNHWSTIFLLAAAQGIFLASMLWMSKSPDRKNLFLGTLIFLFSLSLIDNVWYWTGFYLDFPHLLGISMPFPFAYGVLIFFYFKEALNGNSFSWKNDWRHFIPFCLVLVYLLPYYLNSAEGKLQMIGSWHNSILNVFIIPIVSLISLVYYLISSGKTIRNFEIKREVNILNHKSWVGQIYFAYTLFVLLFISYDLMLYSGISSRISDYVIAISWATFIYYIGYLGFSKSKLLNGIKADTSKYQTTTLTDSASEVIFEKIKKYLDDTKAFTNSELRLPMLAELLSLTPHQLSQVINEHSKSNFSEFINTYRVEEAKTKIASDTRINLLAFEVGFNNKTSFHKAFKKNTGCSPNEWKKKKENNTINNKT